MATKNLLIRGGADFSGMRREMQSAQKNLENFQKRVNSIMKKIGSALGGLAVGKLVKDSTLMAMSVESAFDNIAWNMGKATQAFDKWVKTQSKSLGMGYADAYKYGSVFSNLLGSFLSDAEETAAKTQELMKAAAIIASKTGRTYEDVSERIRSGLLGNTEAIEDLGVFVNISMIEATEAFRRFAGDKSWAELDFLTQQQIRLAAILEQTYARYGDTLADTTQTRHAQFVASLQNIKFYLGQAFLPVYNAVLPALTAMADAIGRVLSVIAQFFQALFGKNATKQVKTQTQTVTQQATAVEGLGNSIKKAGKEAKKVQTGLAGFDELTLVKSTMPGGTDEDASAAVAPAAQPPVSPEILDTSAVETSTNKISKKIQDLANKVKRFVAPIGKFFRGVWDEVSGYASEKFRDIVKFWNKYGGQFLKAVKKIWNGIKPIIKFLVEWVWDSIKGLIDGIIKIFKGIIKFISGAFTGDWKTAFSGIKDIVTGAIEAAWNFLNLVFFKGIVKGIGSLISSFGKGFKNIVTKIKEPFATIEKWFSDKGAKMWNALKQPFSSVFNWFKTNVGDKITSAVAGAKNAVSTKAGEIWGAIQGKFSGAYNWFKTNVADKIGQALGNAKSAVSTKAGDLWNALSGKFKNTYSWFKTNVVDKISSAFSKIKINIQEGLFNSVKSLINKLIDKINSPLKKIRDVKILGMRPFSKLPLIPKLAQGGYVGANSPMLAIIGDNRTEGEIVAPESKIYEQAFRAVSDALRQSGAGGNGNLELTINLGSARIFHEIIRGINQVQRQAGRTLIEV